MTRKQKDSDGRTGRIHARIDPALKESFAAYCESRGVSQALALDAAIRLLLYTEKQRSKRGKTRPRD